MNMRIVVISSYFGCLPIWFDLLLYSCSKNDSFDFIFFTDCDYSGRNYRNVRFINLSFVAYCNIVADRLGISFNPKSPYKLCDLKPYYGVIHKDIIMNYDYWGFADIDLVYGDLSPLMEKARSGKYDLITTHADRVAGHFTLIKSDSSYTNTCMRINKWRERLEDNKVFGLDENDYTLLVYPLQKYIWRAYRFLGKRLKIIYYNFFKPFNVVTNTFSRHFFNEYYTSPLPKNGEKWLYYLQEGKIINPEGVELPYLHFLFFKKTHFYNAKTYWMSDFWQVGDIESTKCVGKIVFSNQRVIYKR